MPKCSYCRFGEPAVLMFDRFYFWCTVCNEYLEECVAEDENQDCDCFELDDRFDDTTKK